MDTTSQWQVTSYTDRWTGSSGEIEVTAISIGSGSTLNQKFSTRTVEEHSAITEILKNSKVPQVTLTEYDNGSKTWNFGGDWISVKNGPLKVGLVTYWRHSYYLEFHGPRDPNYVRGEGRIVIVYYPDKQATLTFTEEPGKFSSRVEFFNKSSGKPIFYDEVKGVFSFLIEFRTTSATEYNFEIIYKDPTKADYGDKVSDSLSIVGGAAPKTAEVGLLPGIYGCEIGHLYADFYFEVTDAGEIKIDTSRYGGCIQASGNILTVIQFFRDIDLRLEIAFDSSVSSVDITLHNEGRDESDLQIVTILVKEVTKKYTIFNGNVIVDRVKGRNFWTRNYTLYVPGSGSGSGLEFCAECSTSFRGSSPFRARDCQRRP